MDIMAVESKKFLLKMVMKYLHKKLGSGKEIHEDLKSCANPVFQILFSVFNEASSQVKEEYQRNMVREVGELGLFIANKDTGYRPIIMWMIKLILDNKEELEEAMEGYLQNPDEWYVNVWHKSKKRTAELQKKGKIPKHSMSHEETIFTPALQKKNLDRIK